MLTFISAIFNEETEIDDLLRHISPYVDAISIMDDRSTDRTPEILHRWWDVFNVEYLSGYVPEENDFFKWHQMEEHSGLPETVKNAALQVVEDESWVLLLDADERFAPGVLDAIRAWLTTTESLRYTHVYFQQLEVIDGVHVRTFQKSKLFKKEVIHFSTGIHEDDRFDGEGIYKPEWVVLHRKTSDKQVLREQEYIETYKKLLAQGKIDEGRYQWLLSLHHYVTQ